MTAKQLEKLCEPLKPDAELADIPVIMITIVHERGLALSLDAADYLDRSKPQPMVSDEGVLTSLFQRDPV